MDKKFNEKIASWNEIDDPEAALNLYWQEIFPEILMRAKKRSTKYLKKYDCLISLVGLSPEPVILTIKILEPEFVLFLYTQDSQTKLDMIKDQAGLSMSQIRHVPVSGSETEDIFHIIKELILELLLLKKNGQKKIY